ncbi:hypothetical protein [Haloarchaeobius sp. HME9146]|uniref:hypothetical protein n=1 Tax=Haloarchaeobius sp. HME9146 TaxID=2978732 RepID=UPI0021C24F1A|nr:hypothetical protein [Haloarchaeobius sp. HME9146]MCT9096327.1 hypothetical protein [Haloarchaeobius sp. HME9146]
MALSPTALGAGLVCFLVAAIAVRNPRVNGLRGDLPDEATTVERLAAYFVAGILFLFGLVLFYLGLGL